MTPSFISTLQHTVYIGDLGNVAHNGVLYINHQYYFQQSELFCSLIFVR